MVDTVNTYQEPNAEDPKYVEEMLQKAEGLDNVSGERPDWLPEKFKSPEDMAAAYSQLERQFHNGEQPESVDTDNMDTGEVQEYLSENGIDFESMSQDFWETGGLSDDQYDALEEIGIPSEIVDQFIDGQMAIMDGTRQQAFNVVGGEESYNEMMEWASTSLSQEEQDAFNEQIDSGDMSSAMFAIQGLSARYRSETGFEPNLVGGEPTDASVGTFQSLAEMTQAMSDPRYEKDPAYREAVARKLSRSSIL